MTRVQKLLLIARSQLRVGVFGFGGPLATMSFMRDELVERYGLVSEDRYLEGLAVVKLLPGPVSTMLAVFLGQQIAGVMGGLLSVFCYILPSFLMLLAIAVLQHHLPPGVTESPVFLLTMRGLQVAVLAVILYTCWKLFTDAVKRPYAGQTRKSMAVIAALGAALLAALKWPELLVLLLAAGGGAFALSVQSRRARLHVELLSVFWVFLSTGLTVFGTGYMVLPHLQRVLVEQKHWIDSRVFLDAVAWGNLTPGPIVIASTYIGYAIRGGAGACIATLGIFAGPVLLMLALAPVLRRVLGKPWVEGLMLGLIPAVAATITVSLWPLARAISWNSWNVALFALALVLAFRKWSVVKIFVVAAVLAFGQALFVPGWSPL